MQKEDPPAPYARRPSFHGSGVPAAVIVPDPRQQSIVVAGDDLQCVKENVLCASDPDDCGMLCDPSDVLGNIFSIGRGSKADGVESDAVKASSVCNAGGRSSSAHRRQQQDEGSDSSSTEGRRAKASDHEAPTTPVKRGRFLVWPVSPK